MRWHTHGATAAITTGLVHGTTILVPNSASQRFRLWESSPGINFNDSFLVGNGRIGAAILGTAASDTVRVNEDSLWPGQLRDRVNPDARASIPVMQDLILAGQNDEASVLATYACAATPISTRYYDFLRSIFFRCHGEPTSADKLVGTVRVKAALRILKKSLGILYIYKHGWRDPNPLG